MAAPYRFVLRSMRSIWRTSSALSSENTLTVFRQKQIYHKIHTNSIRQLPVEAIKSAGSLGPLRTSGSVDDFMKSLDKNKDVYVIGMPFEATLDDMKKFFEGLDIQDIFFVDASKSKVKKICYVRFTDAETRKKAQDRDKKEMGNRYLQVIGIENDTTLGYYFLRQNSSNLKMSNMPFNATKKDVIQWFKPMVVAELDVNFISRGTCVVDLKSAVAVDEALKKNNDKMGNRPIQLEAFIPGAVLKDFEGKYKK